MPGKHNREPDQDILIPVAISLVGRQTKSKMCGLLVMIRVTEKNAIGEGVRWGWRVHFRYRNLNTTGKEHRIGGGGIDLEKEEPFRQMEQHMPRP